MPLTTKTIAVTVSLAGAAVAALVAPDARAQEVERFSLSGDVAVFNIAGNITIERGNAAGVVIELTRGGGDAERLQIETGGLEGWQTLRVIYPEDRIVYPRLEGRSRTQFRVADDGTFGREWSEDDDFPGLLDLIRLALTDRSTGRVTVTGSGSGLEAWADLRVLVPAGQTVALHLGVGEVSASNIEGNLIVDARSAPVTADNLRGTIRLATGSGRIELRGAEGDVVLDTGSGSVRAANVSGNRLLIDTGSGGVTGSDLSTGTVEIDTGSGAVEVTRVASDQITIDTGSGGIDVAAAQLGDVVIDTGSGSVNLDVLAQLRSANIDTGSGGITLTVPPDFGAVVDLDASSGGIHSDLPLQITTLRRRSELRGTIGDGSAQVSIDTGSGTIRIRSR